jgi:hypothetical protein
MLDVLGYHVILFVDFNFLGPACCYSLPFTNSHYSPKLKTDVIHPVTFFLGLNQHTNLGSGSNLPDFVFTRLLII